MAVAAVSNSGTNGSKAKNFSNMFGGISNASVNESTSTNASFSTLVNPDGDSINYRVGRWLSSGSFVVKGSGFADIFMVAGGGSGGIGISGYCAGGGGGGAIVRLKKILMPAGTYNVTIGLGGTAGGAGGNSSVSGPFSNEITSLTATGGGAGGSGHGGGGSGGAVSGVNMTLSHTPGTGGGTGGGGSGGGGGGQGGNGGTGGAAGLGLSVSGWTTTPITFSAGGNGVSYSPVAGSPNTGDAGGGGCGAGNYASGGSGIVYIRWIP
jgi:hypothetical protein